MVSRVDQLHFYFVDCKKLAIAEAYTENNLQRTIYQSIRTQ